MTRNHTATTTHDATYWARIAHAMEEHDRQRDDGTTTTDTTTDTPTTDRMTRRAQALARLHDAYRDARDAQGDGTALQSLAIRIASGACTAILRRGGRAKTGNVTMTDATGDATTTTGTDARDGGIDVRYLIQLQAMTAKNVDDGADVVQAVALALVDSMTAQLPAPDAIKRAYSSAYAYIRGQRQVRDQLQRTAYVRTGDADADGHDRLARLPDYMTRAGIDTHTDAVALAQALDTLPVTALQGRVLRYLIAGHTRPQIADIMDVSPQAIDKHVSLIRAKLTPGAIRALFDA